jgi:hypothetical protein
MADVVLDSALAIGSILFSSSRHRQQKARYW